MKKIVIKGAREHNLKDINLEIPRDKLVVITGLSGSGKSSLAFDTIYAEGQRRYVESLSAYARQFLGQLEKPDLDYIEGLSPAISIEQKNTSHNPRSTVGTITEIYDYFRLLFARIGEVHCYQCGEPISQQSASQIIEQVSRWPAQTKIVILAPLVRGRKGEYKDLLKNIQKQGFLRVKIDGEIRSLDEPIVLDKKKKHQISVVVDRIILRPEARSRLADSIEMALKLAGGQVVVEKIATREEFVFSEHFACPRCEVSFEEISPRMFSFNSPYGACRSCSGLGYKTEIDPDLVVPDKNKSINEGCIAPWADTSSVFYFQMMRSLARYYKFSLNTPFKKLPKKIQKIILYGSGDEEIPFTYRRNEYDPGIEFVRSYEGIISNLARRYRQTSSEASRREIEKYMSTQICSECEGNRLRKESLFVFIQGKSIMDLCRLSIKECFKFFTNLRLSSYQLQIAQQVLKEIKSRLTFLINVGLDYLTLDRTAATLAGGEAQRIRLATQIGSGLMGVLYILDEPTIGLHQRDNTRLIETLKRLRDLGNTVLVVEHDAQTIMASDYVIDLGPGAGEKGGYVVAVGPPQKICKNKNSLTGQYLSGQKKISSPYQRKTKPKGYLEILGARQFNLKNVHLKIPLGLFTCITGVSGSGKSTLIYETLYKIVAQKFYRTRTKPGAYTEIRGLERIDKVINIDQSPIGRTPRSNPATYTGTFTFIRNLFASLPEAKVRNYPVGRFSFNVKGGRCENCQGDGIIKIAMHFLPDVYVSCQSCRGKRYNQETLEITYRGKNIADVLEMTVEEALDFFKNIPVIKRHLQTLFQVGLGYIKLGQSATTLSGGEAQRVKLSAELCKKSTGQTLYILDEPTTGLHFADIQKLLDVLHFFTNQGNTVVVIEHNLDVIKTADYIIDLGPEGGEAGGEIIAEGPPEEIVKNKKSYTGQYLKKVLNGKIEGKIETVLS